MFPTEVVMHRETVHLITPLESLIHLLLLLTCISEGFWVYILYCPNDRFFSNSNEIILRKIVKCDKNIRQKVKK